MKLKLILIPIKSMPSELRRLNCAASAALAAGMLLQICIGRCETAINLFAGVGINAGPA